MGLPVEKRLVFAHAMEGLFEKALKGRLTDRIRERVKAEAGVDLSRKFDPGYPFPRWEKCLVVVSEELFPSLPPDEALEEVGVLLTHGYFQTLMGSALAALLRVIGPARALKRMDRSLRTGNKYTEASVKELGPTRFEFWSNESGLAQFNLVGVLRAGAEISGARNLRTQIVKRDDEGVTIQLEWDA